MQHSQQQQETELIVGTHRQILYDVIKFFGTIDLDPCSNDENNPNVPATKVYTEETNGLAHKWIADRVFMNHPYSDSKTWVPYAVSQYELGYAKELILLIKLDVSTRWWKSVSQYIDAVTRDLSLAMVEVLHHFNQQLYILAKI